MNDSARWAMKAGGNGLKQAELVAGLGVSASENHDSEIKNCGFVIYIKMMHDASARMDEMSIMAALPQSCVQCFKLASRSRFKICLQQI